jgi:hypothetical protein
MEYHKLTREQKIARLKEEQEQLREKYNKLFKTFRGVIHEDSSSEMKYTMIKVMEAHLASIHEELLILEAPDKK